MHAQITLTNSIQCDKYILGWKHSTSYKHKAGVLPSSAHSIFEFPFTRSPLCAGLQQSPYSLRQTLPLTRVSHIIRVHGSNQKVKNSTDFRFSLDPTCWAAYSLRSMCLTNCFISTANQQEPTHPMSHYPNERMDTIAQSPLN